MQPHGPLDGPLPLLEHSSTVEYANTRVQAGRAGRQPVDLTDQALD